MELPAIVRFLTLKKLFAWDMMAELERVHGSKALSLSAVKKWRKRFANGRITLEDDSRSGRPPGIDLCESLRALIDETPYIS
jgi:hypothetical protein